ncbi:hypothetical protein MLD38_010823 [Melastoma candidum]|uniref:Uncharacterized protein n=1 Tax=Melastoma candidum TaxID=119954 RepID=A0ACB9R173_9MYRT|nr:hypothetical protein MLD38_010823 [Melastoma candidum]
MRAELENSCFRDQDRDGELGSGLPDCSLLGHGATEDCTKLGLNPGVTVKKDWKVRSTEASHVLFRAIGKRWSVPWTAETVLQVMALWVTSFWFIGTWVLPFFLQMAGFNKEALTFRGQALYSLLTDVTEGCLMFPAINRLSQINLDLLPILPSTPVTLSSVEQSILAGDPVAMALYAIVVTICAPVWEEVVFRGFLLPSLTRYMPVWCAIIVSSVVFALAHFNVQRMLPLIFLGLVMGVLFTRSRNLVPSMLLHSLWNAFVFASLIR